MHSHTLFCCATVAVLEAQYKVSKQKYVAAIQDRMGLSKWLIMLRNSGDWLAGWLAAWLAGWLAGWQPVAVFVVFLSAMRIHEVS